jgi:hypothetical protein
MRIVAALVINFAKSMIASAYEVASSVSIYTADFSLLLGHLACGKDK